MDDRRDVRISSVPAIAHIRGHVLPDEARSIKELDDVTKQMRNPDELHNCPFCHETFTWPVFVAHARQCIDIHVPKNELWKPSDKL